MNAAWKRLESGRLGVTETTALSALQVSACVVRASSRWLRLLVGWWAGGPAGERGCSWQSWTALELELEATLAMG